MLCDSGHGVRLQSPERIQIPNVHRLDHKKCTANQKFWLAEKDRTTHIIKVQQELSRARARAVDVSGVDNLGLVSFGQCGLLGG